MDDRVPPAALLVLLSLLSPAAAQEDGEPATVEVTMHGDGSDFWFECVGVACSEGRNPPLVLDPGWTYTFHVVNGDERTHDLWLDGLGSTGLLEQGQEENLTVTVPADAEGEGAYWCSIHRGLGMEGLVVYESDVGGGPADNDSPGPGGLLLAVALGAALLLADRVRWRHAPASRRKP